MGLLLLLVLLLLFLLLLVLWLLLFLLLVLLLLLFLLFLLLLMLLLWLASSRAYWPYTFVCLCVSVRCQVCVPMCARACVCVRACERDAANPFGRHCTRHMRVCPYCVFFRPTCSKWQSIATELANAYLNLYYTNADAIYWTCASPK